MKIQLTFMYSANIPGKQGSVINQQWQDELTKYACVRHSEGIDLTVPSTVEDPDHVLYITLTTDDVERLTTLYARVPPRPTTLTGMRLRKVACNLSWDANRGAVLQWLTRFRDVSQDVQQEPTPVGSNAKGG